MKLIKVSNGSNPVYIKSIKEIPEIITDEDFDGLTEITLTSTEMTQEEFDKLPEWDGF